MQTSKPGIFHKLCVYSQNQPPAIFALVMSTGIISLALDMLHMREAGFAFSVLNIVQWLTLTIMLIVRCLTAPGMIVQDLHSHGKSFGFLTFIAATCLLGSEMLTFFQAGTVAKGLFFLSLGVWLVLIWLVPVGISTAENKPSLEKGISGAWLLMTVSTQGLVILGSLLTEHGGFDQQTAAFWLLMLFLLGFMFYFIVITLIFFRFTFYPLTPDTLSPSFWINAGAGAITTLAGCKLLPILAKTTLSPHVPGLEALTMLAWGMAAFWILPLFLFGAWRLRRQPLTYAVDYWAMVFPLGMFTACTLAFAGHFDLSFLRIFPDGFIWIAVAAWVMTFYGMSKVILRAVR